MFDYFDIWSITTILSGAAGACFSYTVFMGFFVIYYIIVHFILLDFGAKDKRQDFKRATSAEEHYYDYFTILWNHMTNWKNRS